VAGAAIPYGMLTRPLVRALGASFAIALLATRPAAAQSKPALAAADIADIITLEKIEDRRAYDEAALQRIAASKHPELRRRAALAIARLYDPRGRALLTAMRAESDTAVLATIVWATGQLVDTSAVGWLDGLLQNGETPAGVATEAAGAFGKIRTSETRDRLVNYLKNAAPSAATAPTVAEALLSIGRHRDRGDLTSIVRWATNPDVEIRWRAAWALFRPRDPAAVPYLYALADDPSADVRFWAIRGLTGPLADSSTIGAAAAQAKLIESLGDVDRRIQTEATRALGRHADLSSLIQLTLLLDEKDVWVAVSAAEALGGRGDGARGAIAQLTAVTTTGHPVALRATAIAALTDISLAAAIKPALAMVNDTSLTVRLAATNALAKLGVSARGALVTLRTDANIDVRTIANTAWLTLADTIEDPVVRRAARKAAFASPDIALRVAAARSMREWADSTDIPTLLAAFAVAAKDISPNAVEATIATIGEIDKRAGGATSAFFKRFPASPSDQAWMIAGREFGERVVREWGIGRPVRGARTDADYKRIVETLVVPAYNGAVNPRLKWETSRGAIETELNPLDAPLATDYLLNLTTLNKIAGVRFDRVVPNFVDQMKEALPSQELQRDEISRGRLVRGNLSWGSEIGARGPGSSYDTGPAVYTFGITPQPHNEGDFTALGRVSAGMDVVDQMELGDVVRRVTRVVAIKK
jgi:HEAT repeat protein/cyclophilin family peptidyl-prolyl cis-trans isomerase